MPVIRPGKYPTSSDVFHSPNVFINGVEVALWKRPSKKPYSTSGSQYSAGVNENQGDEEDAAASNGVGNPSSISEPTTTGSTTDYSAYVEPPKSGIAGDNKEIESALSKQPAESPVAIEPITLLRYASEVSTYIANPDAFRMNIIDVVSGNIKSTYPGTLRSLSLDPIISLAPREAIIPLRMALTMVEGEGLLGIWNETGVQGYISNQTIVGVFADLGYDILSAPFNSDQTPLSMAWVNWMLKRTGYRYTQSIDAWDIKNKTSAWGATQINLEDASPGDIALWSFGHVNFVSDVFDEGKKLKFIGANQCSPSEPQRGKVAVSWQDGYDITNNNSTLIGLYRPSIV